MRWTLALAFVGALSAAPAIAQRAGALIAADPVVATPPGAQAWRVRYWTTSDRGAPIAVTGMVVAPREAPPRTPRKVIAWAHGTWGVTEKCAPSLAADFFTASPAVTAAVAQGYTVVAPDYPGLGSAMAHPYLVGTSTAHSVLDAVRAARGIPGAAAGADFAVWGESQGGHAALWTGQLARRYAPDLRLAAIGATVPPTDLAENLSAASDLNARAMLTAFAAHSWSEHFDAPLATLGKRSTRGLITRLSRNNCIVLNRKPRLGTILGILALRRDLKDVNFGRTEPWARIARDNSPARRDLGAPLFIATGTADTLVSPQLVRSFARALCADRARVRFVEVAGGEHTTVTMRTADDMLAWIGGRFRRERAPSDCGRI